MLFGKKKSDSKKEEDWTDQLTQLIESTISSAADKVIVPLKTIARAIVYGTLAGIVGITALILLSIMVVRILDSYLDNIPFLPDGVWVAHFVTGTVFVLSGLILWAKRSPRHSPSNH